MGEALFLLALGVCIWLFTVFLPAWLQRRQREAPRDVGRQGPPVAPRARAPQPRPAVASHGTPLPAVRPLVTARQPAPVRLGSRRDIRRAIVLMTLLGPCRALEPPDCAR